MSDNVPRQRARPRHAPDDLYATVTKKNSGKAFEEEVIEPRTLTTPSDVSASVWVEGSVTKNMGNYESVKVSAGVRRPCADTPEAINAMYGEISEMVDDFLQRELELASGAENA